MQESTKRIITQVGKSIVVEAVNEADIIIVDILDKEIDRTLGEILLVKTCVKLNFVYDFFFGCRAVKVDDYQLRPK